MHWRGLPDGALEPGYAGIRPKISGKDARPADFVCRARARTVCAEPGDPYGIESPD